MEYERLETLRSLCESLAWASEADVVYRRLVETAAACFNADAATLHLLEVDGSRFVRHASYTDSSPWSYRTDAYDIGFGRLDFVLDKRDVIVMDYLHPDKRDVVTDDAMVDGYHFAITLPLYTDAGVVGMLNLVYRQAVPISDEDRSYLRGVGQTLGVLVNRVQMTKKHLELQMLLERKRLSSEIHDNLAQMVSALGIKADTAIDCRGSGDEAELARELDQLSEMARQVTKMLRSEMLTLRAPLGDAGDVKASIQELVERFEKQWGIAVLFDCREPGELTASDYVRLQLVRIVNESLQNVPRHAKADHVFVTIDSKNSTILISVRDDGCGFDVDAVSDERLGLRIMRERARSAGGALSIVSGVSGTTVSVEMPASKS